MTSPLIHFTQYRGPQSSIYFFPETKKSNLKVWEYSIFGELISRKSIPQTTKEQFIATLPKPFLSRQEECVRQIGAMITIVEERLPIEKALYYAKFSRDFQKCPNAIEELLKNMNLDNPPVPRATRKQTKNEMLLAHFYLAKYQVEEGKMREALQTLSHCFRMNTDLKDVLKEIEILNQSGLHFALHPASYNLQYSTHQNPCSEDSDCDETMTAVEQLQCTGSCYEEYHTWTLENITEEQEYADEITQNFDPIATERKETILDNLFTARRVKDEFELMLKVFNSCQVILSSIEKNTTLLGLMPKPDIEWSIIATAKNITDGLKQLTEQYKKNTEVQQTCTQILKTVQAALQSYVLWSNNHKSIDFQMMRDDFVNVLTFFEQEISLAEQNFVTSHLRTIPQADQKNFQLLLRFSEIAKEVDKAISQINQKEILSESLSNIKTAIQSAQEETTFVAQSMEFADQLIKVILKLSEMIHKVASVFSDENGVLWKIISPMHLLLQETKNQAPSATEFAFAATLVLNKAETISLLSQLLIEDPNFWPAYSELSQLQTDVAEQAHTLLKGSCQALQSGDYNQAKTFIDDAQVFLAQDNTLNGFIYHWKKSKLNVHFIHSMILADFFSITQERESLGKCLTKYLLLSAGDKPDCINQEKGRSWFFERMQIGKMKIKLDPENVEENKAIRAIQIQLRKADSSYPLEKEIRYSLRTLSLLVQKENWQEAAALAKELLASWTQLSDGPFKEKMQDQFSKVTEYVKKHQTHLTHASEDIIEETPPTAQQENPLQDPLFATTPLIYVRLLNSKQFTLGFCELTDTIETLKRKIEQLKKIAVDEQRVIFKGKQLENDRTLDSYDIKTESVLDVVLRLRGD